MTEEQKDIAESFAPRNFWDLCAECPFAVTVIFGLLILCILGFTQMVTGRTDCLISVTTTTQE